MDDPAGQAETPRKQQHRIAARLTETDRHVLATIERGAASCWPRPGKRRGVVLVDGTGQPGLETSGKISVYRVARLVALGVLVSNGDGLFEWCPQTYRLADVPPTPQPATPETQRP